jgi:ketosteroid isomerase-like protein
MFDVPPPFLSRGLNAYMGDLGNIFSRAEKPIAFDIHYVKITSGKDAAFATATGQCADIDPKGKREELKFRLTMCFRKTGGRWRVMHEHHSLPAV